MGSCEHGNTSLSSTKCGKFVDYIRTVSQAGICSKQLGSHHQWNPDTARYPLFYIKNVCMWHDLTGLSTSEFLQQEYKYFI